MTSRKTLMLIAIGMILLSCTTKNADTITYVKPPPGVENEFRFLGGGLACITNSLSETEGMLPCLHFGDIYIGDSLQIIEKSFNNIHDTILSENGKMSRVYLLNTDAEMYPYMVVTYIDSVADAIQLTGLSTTDNLDFASIKLGSSKSYVDSILGNWYSKSMVSEINGEVLSFSPFPISIEIVDDKVYSVRIWHP